MTIAFPFAARYWWVVKRSDVAARLIADRHYSRVTPGADEFLGPGRTLVLLGDDGLAVWGAAEALRCDQSGIKLFRCAIFRNEGQRLSSDLVREATNLTYEWWINHYGGLPEIPFTTEIDPGKTRRKRDPGRCFLRAGWTKPGPHRRD